MIWATINILTGIVVATIIVFKLAGYNDTFNSGERIGMLGIAMFSVLRIGPILGRRVLEADTPFDDWTVTGLHISLAVYFVARMGRLHRHWIRSDRAKRQALAHLASRGKI